MSAILAPFHRCGRKTESRGKLTELGWTRLSPGSAHNHSDPLPLPGRLGAFSEHTVCRVLGAVPAALRALELDTPGRGLSWPGRLLRGPSRWDERLAWFRIHGIACSLLPRPGLSSAQPAAPWESPGFFSALPWRHRGGAWGNLLLPAGGCQRPCPPFKRGFPAPHQLCSLPLCLYRDRAGSGAMPGPITPARGIKVSRMQLCLLDLTRPEGRFLQPEFTAP